MARGLDLDVPPSAKAPEASERVDETRAAGRGLLSITGAKVYFIVTSYALQLLLPRLLGSPRAYGLYSAAIGLVSILNNVLIAATVQSVSKLVSEDESRAQTTLRQGLKIQLVVGGVLSGVLYVVSPWVATDVLLDPALGPLLRIASAVVLSYALYATLIGSLNGRRLFQRQARLDMTFSTLRTGGMITAAALGFGVIGVVGGFASAAVSILLIAMLVVGLGKPGEPRPLRRWLTFMAPLWLYQVLLNCMLQIDIAVLKRTVAQLGLATGLASLPAADLASTYAGFYRAAQTFAFVPYQLILSITFIVFPTVSRATSLGDIDKTRSTIRGAMRFSLLVLVAIAAPISGAADGVLRIAYPANYVAGAQALQVLVLGMVAFALFVIAATILSGAGRPATAAAIAFVSLAVVIAGNRIFVMRVGLGDHTLAAAALGTSIGMVVALVASAFALRAAFGAFLPLASAARVLVAGGAAFAVAHLVPHTSPLLALVALGGGFLTFVAGLFALREVKQADLDVIKRVLGRG